MTLGTVSESVRDYRAAGDAYRQAAAIPGPQQGEAQIGAARVLVLTGDKPGAIAAYRLFLTQNPYSPDREDVVEALARMGAAPQIARPAPSSVEVSAKRAAPAPPAAALKPAPPVAAKPPAPAASATH
jgi:Flp pilus assembly protein TadD